MTTLNPLLARPTHPQRKPFVRSHTFVDGVGPSPYSFFDETQDHVGALYHAALGWRYSLDSDEFTEVGARPGYLGRLRVALLGATVAPKTTSLGFGEHGVWEARSGAAAYSIDAEGGALHLGGDFLFTAKVMLFGRDRQEFYVGVANHIFFSGSGIPTWLVQGPTGLTISDVPVLDGIWYRLQVSRVAGAARWYINGQLVRARGREGVPSTVRPTRAKYLLSIREAPGPAGDGFAVDSFHLLAERT